MKTTPEAKAALRDIAVGYVWRNDDPIKRHEIIATASHSISLELYAYWDGLVEGLRFSLVAAGAINAERTS